MKGIYFDLVASAVIWERFKRQSLEILSLIFGKEQYCIYLSSFFSEGRLLVA